MQSKKTAFTINTHWPSTEHSYTTGWANLSHYFTCQRTTGAVWHKTYIVENELVQKVPLGELRSRVLAMQFGPLIAVQSENNWSWFISIIFLLSISDVLKSCSLLIIKSCWKIMSHNFYMEMCKHTWIKSKHATCLNSIQLFLHIITFAVYILSPKLTYFHKSVMTKLCILMTEPQLHHYPDFIMYPDKFLQFQKEMEIWWC